MANEYEYINDTGVIVPQTSALQAEVEAEYLAVFGADMSTDPSTPQGVLITAETLARKSVVDNNAALANQINPNIAGGVFLDAICALTGLVRSAATRSLLSDVVVNGAPYTIIPEGSRAKTGQGDVFETVGTVVLDVSGAGTVDFQSAETGAVPCAIAALTILVDTVLGWETVSNPTAADLGVTEQSDASLRLLRQNTLALQGISLVEAITSALYATDGVLSIQFRENTASIVTVIDGVSMAAHSVWACVDGGTDADIGWALLQNKSNGAGWNGAVSVNVVEPASGQTYVVLFDRPTAVPIVTQITVKVSAALLDPQTAVIDAVLAYAAGSIAGEGGFTVGTSVSPFELAAAVNSQIAGIYVQKVEVSLASVVSWQTTEIALAIYEQATIDSGSITVVIA